MGRLIPDNAAKSIENAIMLCVSLKNEWRAQLQRAIDERDIVMQALLANQRETISELDRHIRNARHNIYEE